MNLFMMLNNFQAPFTYLSKWGFFLWRWCCFVVKGERLKYVLGKLTGAGVGIVFGFVYVLWTSGGDWVEPFQLLWKDDSRTGGLGRLLWIALYAFGLPLSMAVDGVLRWRGLKARPWVLALLHALAGFLFFVPMGLRSFPSGIAVLLIAGVIGALCALVFFAGTQWGRRSTWARWLLGVVLPLVIIGVASWMSDPVVRGWEEQRTDVSYEASFQYMNGVYPVSIAANTGQTIDFKVTWMFAEDGEGITGLRAWGPEGRDSRVDWETRTTTGNHTYAGVIRADRDGEYSLGIHGDRVAGRFLVEWTVR
jgi:hypothetical protein